MVLAFMVAGLYFLPDAFLGDIERR
jgi:hypothetical protein